MGSRTYQINIKHHRDITTSWEQGISRVRNDKLTTYQKIVPIYAHRHLCKPRRAVYMVNEYQSTSDVKRYGSVQWSQINLGGK